MEINYKYAGFWRRFFAMLVDTTITGALHFFLFICLLKFYFHADLSVSFTDNDSIKDKVYLHILGLSFIAFMVCFPITYLIYSINPITSKWQGTLGKRIMGIYVINQDGAKLTKIKMVGRSVFAYIIPFILFLYSDKPLFSLNEINIIICIGFIMSAFTPKKVALHDIIFKTYVIRGKL